MEYEQDSSATFYPTFVDTDGSPANIVSGAITINHRAGSSTKVDVNNVALVQLLGSTYYYTWNIPSGANKAIYNARYIGVDSDGNVGVGSDSFHVIPRRFYDKKGGGFTQHVTGRGIWTVREKEELIKLLKSLSEKSEIKMEELKGKLVRLSGSMLGIESDSGKIDESIKTGVSGISNKLEGLMKEVGTGFDSQQGSIKEQSKAIDNISSRGTARNSLVVKELSSLSKSVADVGENLRNEKIGLVISELDDLRKQVDEFKSNLGSEIEDLKEAFVLSISQDTMERLKDETT